MATSAGEIPEDF